ncbi:sigma-54 dependent transcriptional regulator, partial [Myxococcota bacterium]|nr:sigma-54 dependent transcriptional regulator [Myxococcota bacterium]
MSRILVVEDERVIRSEVKRLLVRAGHDVAEAETLAEAEEQDLGGFDLVIADLRLPGGHGTELIAKAEGVPVLIMTSYATVRSAIDAMKQGAVDYLSKPFDTDELLMLVDRILSDSKLRRQNVALKNDVARTFGQEGMVGHSRPMLEVFERIRKVAPTDATVLVRGESGTGKELVARAIHAESKRRDAAFVAVNCAAIPEGLVESELFGHEKGAFTGAVAMQAGMIEIAHGGTLFLDEIGELPLPAQARLLRVLQQAEIRRVGSSHVRKVDVRVIAATHRDLEVMVRESRFREDLYFRLQVLEITLPPLRERGEDIEELALALLEKIATRLGRAEVSFTREGMTAVRAHPWPGNVRELENAIERAVILCDDGRITPRLLGIDRPLR